MLKNFVKIEARSAPFQIGNNQINSSKKILEDFGMSKENYVKVNLDAKLFRENDRGNFP